MEGESSYDILIRNCQTVEYIAIEDCECFANIFTPTLTNSDVGTLMNVSIDGRRPLEESRRNTELVQKSQETNVISKQKISKVHSKISDDVFQIFPHKSLEIRGCKGVNVVFEIESSCSRDLTATQHNQQLLLLPCIKQLRLRRMETMSHVWKCNLNKLVIPRNQSFHNLTTITLEECKSIKYLFPPLIGKLLTNLKEVTIHNCDGIEEVVSNRYDDNDEMATSISAQTNTMFCHHLERLDLYNLPSLKSIDGGNARGRSSEITSTSTITTTFIHDQFKCSQVDVASWFICQYSK